MRKRSELMAALRSERKPLAYLVGLALAARIILLSLGFVSFSNSAEAGLAVLCIPGALAQSTESTQAFKDICPCGIACPHATMSKLPPAGTSTDIAIPTIALLSVLSPWEEQQTRKQNERHRFHIRAPPLQTPPSLT